MPQKSWEISWDPAMSICCTYRSERQCPWISTAVLSCMWPPPIALHPVISLSLFFLHCIVPQQWPLRSELVRPPLPHSNHKVWSPAHPIIPLSCFLYQRERTRRGGMNIKCVFWSADSSRVWNCGALRLKAETAGKASWMEGCSFNSMPETRLKKTESWCTAYVQSPVHNSTQYLWYYYWDVTATVTQNRSPVSYFMALFLIKPCVVKGTVHPRLELSSFKKTIWRHHKSIVKWSV